MIDIQRLTLKQWRLAKQKTIAEMAEVCGVHPNTYIRWEAHQDDVSVGNAVKISRFLDVPIDDIFFGK